MQELGCVFAALRYSGQVDEELCTQRREELLLFMAEDGLEPQKNPADVHENSSPPQQQKDKPEKY